MLEFEEIGICLDPILYSSFLGGLFNGQFQVDEDGEVEHIEVWGTRFNRKQAKWEEVLITLEPRHPLFDLLKVSLESECSEQIADYLDSMDAASLSTADYARKQRCRGNNPANF